MSWVDVEQRIVGYVSMKKKKTRTVSINHIVMKHEKSDCVSAEEEQDTTKRGLPHAPCSRTPALPPQARRANAALRRRSLQPDIEGSGSGM